MSKSKLPKFIKGGGYTTFDKIMNVGGAVALAVTVYVVIAGVLLIIQILNRPATH